MRWQVESMTDINKARDGHLRMFLHLEWGGAYDDDKKEAPRVAPAF
jgi:hypothetical protein